MKFPLRGRYIALSLGTFAALDIVINICLQRGFELPRQVNLAPGQWLVREHVLNKDEWLKFLRRPDVLIGLTYVFIASGSIFTLPTNWNPLVNQIGGIGAGANGDNGGPSVGYGGGGGAFALTVNYTGFTAGQTVSIQVGYGVSSSFSGILVAAAASGSTGGQAGSCTFSGPGSYANTGGNGGAPVQLVGTVNFSFGGGGAGAAGPNGGGQSGWPGWDSNPPSANAGSAGAGGVGGGNGGVGDNGSGGGGGGGSYPQFATTPPNGGGGGFEINGVAGAGGGGGGASCTDVGISGGGGGGGYGGGGGAGCYISSGNPTGGTGGSGGGGGAGSGGGGNGGDVASFGGGGASGVLYIAYTPPPPVDIGFNITVL